MDNTFYINNCTLERVNQTLNESFNIIKNVPFQYNQIDYFNSIYSKLSEQMKIDENFLKDAECLSIYKLYQKILESNQYENEGKIKPVYIIPNSILLIKCPSIFASYHYLVAVIDENRSYVDTYQSFGSTYRLRKISMSYKEFEFCLNYLNKIKKNIYKNKFAYELPYLLKIENKLNGIDIDEYVNILLEQYKDDEYDEELSDLNEKDKEILDKLNIPYLIGDNLKHNYSLLKSESVDINLYIVKNFGGKLKKYKKNKTNKKNKKNKTNKTNKSKKYKK